MKIQQAIKANVEGKILCKHELTINPLLLTDELNPFMMKFNKLPLQRHIRNVYCLKASTTGWYMVFSLIFYYSRPFCTDNLHHPCHYQVHELWSMNNKKKWHRIGNHPSMGSHFSYSALSSYSLFVCYPSIFIILVTMQC